MKRVIKLSLVAMFACVAGYGVYQSQKKVSLSALNLANIEALANNESGGNYEYPDGQPMVSECGIRVGVFQYCKATVINCSGGGDGCNSRKCPQHG